MTLLEIKTEAAHILDLGVSDLTVNGQDMGLLALNHTRRRAEEFHDFEFSRKLVQLAVDGETGGSLENAVLYSDGATAVNIKTVVECGFGDAEGNFRPTEWTTVAENIERQREENMYVVDRYPGDDNSYSDRMRVMFTGDEVFVFPKSSTDFTLLMEVYTELDDWVSGDLSSSIVPWTTNGAQYLLWQTVEHLNFKFREFVYRQQGNIGERSLKQKADEELKLFRQWDIFKYEQFRRHR